jgi:hypothetical protein
LLILENRSFQQCLILNSLFLNLKTLNDSFLLIWKMNSGIKNQWILKETRKFFSSNTKGIWRKNNIFDGKTLLSPYVHLRWIESWNLFNEFNVEEKIKNKIINSLNHQSFKFIFHSMNQVNVFFQLNSFIWDCNVLKMPTFYQ